LILVALNDRKMRIEHSSKTWELLSPEACSQIMEETMRPHFRNKEYTEGIKAAIASLTERLEKPKSPQK
ncbi:MAG TPA: TPM domain-containing protein, partial [Verrucomicrobiae bacterium]